MGVTSVTGVGNKEANPIIVKQGEWAVAKTDSQPMGVGLLANSSTVFCRSFRWTLKGNKLPENFVKNVKIDYLNKTISFEYMDIVCTQEGTTEVDRDHIFEFVNNINNESLVFKQFDGCGVLLKEKQFHNLKLISFESSEYDYGSSDVSTHKVIVSYELLGDLTKCKLIIKTPCPIVINEIEKIDITTNSADITFNTKDINHINDINNLVYGKDKIECCLVYSNKETVKEELKLLGCFVKNINCKFNFANKNNKVVLALQFDKFNKEEPKSDTKVLKVSEKDKSSEEIDKKRREKLLKVLVPPTSVVWSKEKPLSKYNCYWTIDLGKGNPEIEVKIEVKPNITIEETEINYLNGRIWCPGKAKAESVYVYMTEDAFNKLTNQDWFFDDKSTVKLHLYNAAKKKLETWELIGCMFSHTKDNPPYNIVINFDQYNYKSVTNQS